MWFQGSRPLYNDPPHVRIRNSTDGNLTSSVLIIDSFGTLDNGSYYCQANDGMSSSVSPSTNLSGKLVMHFTIKYLTIPFSTTSFMHIAISNGEMYVLRDPVAHETTTNVVGEEKDYDSIRDNRTATQNGTDFEPDQYFNTECCQVLRCIAAVPGNVIGAPDIDLATAVWMRDEEELSYQPNRIEILQLDATYDVELNITRFHTDLRLTPFLQSRDTGVYQCLFFNYGNYREIVTTTPIRLDSGKLFWNAVFKCHSFFFLTHLM